VVLHPCIPRVPTLSHLLSMFRLGHVIGGSCGPSLHPCWFPGLALCSSLLRLVAWLWPVLAGGILDVRCGCGCSGWGTEGTVTWGNRGRWAVLCADPVVGPGLRSGLQGGAETVGLTECLCRLW
jgi:hypothetical protein